VFQGGMKSNPLTIKDSVTANFSTKLLRVYIGVKSILWLVCDPCLVCRHVATYFRQVGNPTWISLETPPINARFDT
jgi:hypothetical protein